MADTDFVATLNSHNLTVTSFLDLKDDWERLYSEVRYMLVRNEYLAEQAKLLKQKEIEESDIPNEVSNNENI